MVAEKAGDEKRTAAFSLLAFIGWVASAMGGFIISSVYPLENLGFSFGQAHIVLFIVMGLLNLSITPMLFWVKDTTTYRERRGILPRKSALVMAKFGGYTVTIALGAGLFVPLMALWFSQAFQVPDAVSGVVLGVTSLLTAGVVFVSPRLARRLGLVRATVVTQAASIVFMVLIPSSPTFGVAASLYLVRVFLMNLSNPLTQSLIMGLVSPDERGAASGVSAALGRLPNSLSANVGSELILGGRLAAPFYIATVLYVVGISMFWFFFRNSKVREELPRGSQAPIQSSSLEGPEAER
jgi:MFS-type transporter involved in bile tolerance (Atg22 family)